MENDTRGLSHFAKITAITIAVVLAFSLSANGNNYSLINDQPVNLALSNQLSELPADFPPAWRSRPVTLNPVIAEPDVLVPGDTITLNLFADVMLSARIDRVSTNINGTVTVRGRIEDYPLGYIIISTTNGNSLASIDIPDTGESYLIQKDSLSGKHYLLEENIDQLDKLEDSPPKIPPSPRKNTAAMEMLADTPANDPLAPVTLDVMIVYTPAARQWADSSGGGIANVIAQAVTKGQLALDNSNTILTLNLVYSGEISYTESGDSGIDLDRLTNTSDGYMDSVHTLRDQYYADIVGLFTKVDDTGGIGWLLSSTSGMPESAFSISRVQQVGWTYTYIHEMGHNMGCHHRKDQATQPGPGIFSYSAGWHWIGNDSGKYCSVMSYEDGGYTTVAYFSNPDIFYQGVATGDAADGDNARTIRETKTVVAAYRQFIPTGSLSVTISPQGAINAGAQWRRVGTSTWLNSGYTESGIATGQYTVEFSSISGWNAPASQIVQINYNQTTYANGTYTAFINIGSGTSSWDYPLHTYYHDARTQTIYLASEIGGAYTFNSLSLDVTTIPGQLMNNFTIRLKETQLAAYGASPVWESTGWTTVYQSNQTISATGWTSFTFTTPFSYSGNQNLMVDICFNNSSYTSNGQCLYTSLAANRSLTFSTDSGYGDPLTWAYNTPVPVVSTYFPNIRLGYSYTSTPVFTPDTGSYSSKQNVIITCDTPGAVIRYSTNGNDPTESSPAIASGSGLLIGHSLRLKARAWKTGITSGIKTADYQLAYFCPEADLSGDCVVNFKDFVLIANWWLYNCDSSNGWCQGADFDLSGNTGIPDVNVLADQWLTGNIPSGSDDTLRISGGLFQMGDSLSEGSSIELPVHAVTLNSFYMGKFEVTNQQYCAYLNSAILQGLITVTGGVVYQAGSGTNYPYCDTSASDFSSQIAYSGGLFTVCTKGSRNMADDPMVMVSWYGAAAYCNWRSQQASMDNCYNLYTWACDFTKNSYRLATEAEWEYAARGGLSGKRFPWGDTITHDQANYYSSGSYGYDISSTNGFHPNWEDGIYPYTSPTGIFAANAYGLYDMAGNVMEWCNDWYLNTYYSSSPANNPTGPTSGGSRILRGGDWLDDAYLCRTACRYCNLPYSRSILYGFRVARNSN